MKTFIPLVIIGWVLNVKGDTKCFLEDYSSMKEQSDIDSIIQRVQYGINDAPKSLKDCAYIEQCKPLVFLKLKAALDDLQRHYADFCVDNPGRWYHEFRKPILMDVVSEACKPNTQDTEARVKDSIGNLWKEFKEFILYKQRGVVARECCFGNNNPQFDCSKYPTFKDDCQSLSSDSRFD